MFVYIVGILGQTVPVKVGKAKQPTSRLIHLQNGNHQKLEILHARAVESAGKVERATHSLLARHRLAGEWFNVSYPEALRALDQAVLIVAKAPEQFVNREWVVSAAGALWRVGADSGQAGDGSVYSHLIAQAMAEVGEFPPPKKDWKGYIRQRRKFAKLLAQQRVPLDVIARVMRTDPLVVKRWISL